MLVAADFSRIWILKTIHAFGEDPKIPSNSISEYPFG